MDTLSDHNLQNDQENLQNIQRERKKFSIESLLLNKSGKTFFFSYFVTTFKPSKVKISIKGKIRRHFET